MDLPRASSIVRFRLSGGGSWPLAAGSDVASIATSACPAITARAPVSRERTLRSVVPSLPRSRDEASGRMNGIVSSKAAVGLVSPDDLVLEEGVEPSCPVRGAGF